MRRFKPLQVLVLGALVLSSLPLPSGATNDPPSGGGVVTGDWVVDSDRSYSGVTITVSGNIIITSGKTLTLSGVTLYINSPAGSPCRLEVLSGGKLYTSSGTTITSGNGNPYYIWVRALAKADIRATNISKCGTALVPAGRGLHVSTSDAVFEGCVVKDGYWGFQVDSDASPLIVNSTIKDHQDHAVYCDRGFPTVDNCTITGCGFTGSQAAVYVTTSNSTQARCRISNCTISGNNHGVYFNLDSPGILENCTVSNSTLRGVWVRLSNPLIRDNNITGNKENNLFLEEASPRIERNDITKSGTASQATSGIYVYFYSYPLIEDNYIASNLDTGINVRPNSAPTIRRNNITLNTNIGINLNYCGNALIEDNLIFGNNDGVKAQGSTPTIRRNSIINNQNDGFHADGGTAVFEQNLVNGSGAAGIHALGAARLTVGNCTFAGGNQWGIDAQAGSTVSLVNGFFSDEFREAFKSDLASTVDWLVDAGAGIDGDDATLGGDLTVSPTGSLSLKDLRFQLHSTAALRRRVTVQPGGELSLAGCNLTAYDPSQNYQFTSRGKLAASGSTLEECGYDWGSAGETAGISLLGGSASLDGCTVSQGYCGLVARDCTVTAGSSLIGGCDLRSVDMSGAVLLAENCTLTASTAGCLRLDRASRAELVNSSFDRNSVAFQDASSVLNASWFLQVKVEWAGGEPGAGATVAVRDRQDRPVFTGLADPEGLTPQETVQELTQTGAGKESFTPHAVSATSGLLSNATSVTVDRTQLLTVVLRDDTPPSLAILAPADGAFLTAPSVSLQGTASDPDSGIARVEVSSDNRTWVAADTADGWAHWNRTLDLFDGTWPLHARATNGAGARVLARVEVVVKLTGPYLVINFPRDGFLTNQTSMNVRGSTEREARVTAAVNGGPEVEAVNTNGDYGVDVALFEGQNTIVVTAADRAGNLNRTQRTGTVDTIAPWILLERPPVSYSTETQVAVNGTTDGIYLTVNGLQGTLANGSFSVTVQLQVGTGTTNTSVEVVSRDLAGNANRTTIFILRDLTLPSIRFETPFKDVSLTNQPAAWFNGTVSEAGCTLMIGGAAVPVDADGRFSHLIGLKEGANIVNVDLTDPAGNPRRYIKTVHRDTQPPSLVVTRPLDGSRTQDTFIEVAGATDTDVVELRFNLTFVNATVNTSKYDEKLSIDADGNFSRTGVELVLNGSNIITLGASDRAGNWAFVRLTVFRDEQPTPPPPPRPKAEPQPWWMTKLPWILILVIVIAGAGAGAAIAFGGRKRSDEERPKGRPAGRPMSPLEARAARRQGPPAGQARTAEDLYGKDYASRARGGGAARGAPQAAPASWPAELADEEEAPAFRASAPPGGGWSGTAGGSAAAPEPALAPHDMTWEPEMPAAEGAAAPDAPAPAAPPWTPEGPAGTAPGEAAPPAAPEPSHAKVDDDIGELLKKLGEVSPKKK